MTFFLFYTDPGSGVMLLQVLFAFLAGILFYFRKFLSRLFRTDKNSDKLPKTKEKTAPPLSDNKNEV